MWKPFPVIEKCSLFFSLCVVFVQMGFAQQLSLFVQNQDNHSFLNPAALNNDQLIFRRTSGVEIGVRNYLVGADLAPKTGAISAHRIIDPDIGVKLLLGLNMLFDDKGFTQTIAPQLRVAGIFSTNPDRERIVVGLSGGWSQFRIKTDGVVLVDAGDVKGMTGLTQWYPEASLGAFYSRWLENDDNIYIGVSLPQLLSINRTIRTEAGEYLLERQAHYMGNLGYHKFLNDRSFVELSARLMVVPDFPLYYDAKIRWDWKRILWMGAGLGNNGFLLSKAGFYVGKTGQKNLALGFGMNTPVFGDAPLPFGNSFEVKLNWSK